ncbi:P-loop containing nucleoside triphosphate hydrolase protein, partial [Ramicandelaber brevisporus]
SRPVKSDDGFERSYETYCSIFSAATFNWVTPTIRLGNKKRLDPEDLDILPTGDQAKIAYDRFKAEEREDRSLLKNLFWHYRELVLCQFMYVVLHNAFIFAGPLCLNMIVQYFQNGRTGNKIVAYLWAIGIFVGPMLSSFSNQRQTWIGRRFSFRLKGIISQMVVEKTLKLPYQSPEEEEAEMCLKTAIAGKVLNLLTTDIQNITNICGHIALLYGLPIQIVVGFYLLYSLLGVSVFIGLAVGCIALVPGSYVIKKLFAFYDLIQVQNDKRVNAINELFQSIRIAKMFAWSDRFIKKIDALREEQINVYYRMIFYEMSSSVLMNVQPVITILVTFFTYTVVFGHALTPAVAFTSLSILKAVQGAVSGYPRLISLVISGKTSLNRIDDFMKAEEVEELLKRIQAAEDASQISAEPSNLGFVNASFQWGRAPFKLSNLNVRFPTGKLSVIAGNTGQGKTSLLLALLGEMTRIEGDIVLPTTDGNTIKDVSYVAQTAWLRNATIRNNIVFGEPYDEERYRAVLHACALNPDLRVLPAGSETEVGEKGVTLSGGQKQRLALARAVYSRTSTVLLDDCLSAVDSDTAKHIFKECILGPLMKDRTVVLVTHHVSLVLGAAAHVAVIHEGTVVAQGKPADVVARGYVKDVTEADLREARELVEKSSTSHNDHSVATATNVEQGKLVEEEEREIGSVGWAVYKAFGDASGGSMFWALLVFVCVGFRMSTVLQDWWLRIWSSSYDTSTITSINSDGAVVSFTAMSDSEPTIPAHSLYYYLSWFMFFGLLKIAVSVIMQFFVLWSSIKLGRTVHAALLRRLVNATPRFFDRTPLGRIISRFSSDMKALDQDVMARIFYFLSSVINAILICVVISTTVPSFILPGILISLSGYVIMVYYLNASREIKRIELVLNAPLLSLYGELASGVTTIRAYGVVSRFRAEGDKYVDGFNRAFYMTWAANRWLCFLMDVLGASVSLVSALLILYNAEDYTAASAGFTLSYALSFSHTALRVARMYSELEMGMNSMERIEQYMKVEQEAPGIIPNCRPPASWPHQGEVVVRGLHARYAPEAPQVIKGISFSTRPGERIGIVGRTGAGKSSLGLLLLRMLEAESGSIEIDGIDISKIG